jgi:uncharacterized protein
MDFLIGVIGRAFGQTLVSLGHNWPYLLASIAIAAALKAFVDTDKLAARLTQYKGASVLAATLLAVATPLCSCGTTAIVLGMMASTMPWAPIVAFMVASPLSSPEGIVYSAGLFGWPFALFYFAASILLGIGAGYAAMALEKGGLLKNQVRFDLLGKAASSPKVETAACDCASPRFQPAATACSCGAPRLESAASSCDCGSGSAGTSAEAVAAPAEAAAWTSRSAALGREAWNVAKTILPMFLGFAFLGYLINGLIPASWIQALFGSGRAYGVPLAATIGIPLYINSEASMPLARALLDSGMSRGAIMAFLVAGSGTSVGAIAGALTIARRRVVALVVASLWVGAILTGWLFDFIVAAGIA